jgi:hypothetical protein
VCADHFHDIRTRSYFFDFAFGKACHVLPQRRSFNPNRDTAGGANSNHPASVRSHRTAMGIDARSLCTEAAARPAIRPIGHSAAPFLRRRRPLTAVGLTARDQINHRVPIQTIGPTTSMNSQGGPGRVIALCDVDVAR